MFADKNYTGNCVNGSSLLITMEVHGMRVKDDVHGDVTDKELNLLALICHHLTESRRG
jgi:hypothetical protein